MTDTLDYITNNPIDETYLLHLHEHLTQMKNHRKQTEKDAETINTRINCLKNEQAKTLKQIEFTNQKTREKAINIERKVNESRDRNIYLKRKEEQLAHLRRKNLIKKTKLINNMSSKKSEMIKYNQEEAKLLKEQQRKNEELMQSLIQVELNDKKNKIEFIKTQHEINEGQNKLLERINKKNGIKNELEMKIQRELMLKEENDRKIEMLKQNEREIINKIDDIRQMHKQLINEFQMLYTGELYEGNKH